MDYVPPDVFGEDYLYFYEDVLDDELSTAQAELLWATLRLVHGAEVLDVPCGHGRIANRLAARGARVTGLDADASFLARARDDAVARGVEVDYVQGRHERPAVGGALRRRGQLVHLVRVLRR
ncbi:MAG: methyltransferase domain-containing protein [Gaiellaceae bacterium]